MLYKLLIKQKSQLMFITLYKCFMNTVQLICKHILDGRYEAAGDLYKH